MIDEVQILDEETKVGVILNKSFGNPYILTTDGIDWGNVKATHTTYKNLTGVGVDIENTSLIERTISFTGVVSFTHTTKEYIELYHVSTVSEVEALRTSEIEVAKAKLGKLINPLNVLRVVAGNYYITGKPTASVVFSPKWKENNDILCKFTFSIDCPNPAFRQSSLTSTVLSGTEGAFHFPLIISQGEGIIMGEKTQYQLVIVQNASVIDIGGVITYKALAQVNNPKVTDVYKQESITINKSLVAGEIIKVDTVNRTIVGSIDNGASYSNYFSYWDFDNDWLQFASGSSLIGFSTDDDTYKSLQLSISIEQELYTLEEQ